MEIYVRLLKDMNFYLLIQDEIQEQNKLDQAIYKYFNNTFWETIRSYGSNFSSDLRELRSLSEDLENYCKRLFRDTNGAEDDIVCRRMKWDDKEYVTYLKAKYQGITNVQLNSSGLLYLKNSLEFYFNTTSKEIQRYLDSQ